MSTPADGSVRGNEPFKSDPSKVETLNIGAGMMTDTKAIFHAEGHQTGMDFGLVEIIFRHGDATGPHVHKLENEGFYILEGELTLHMPGRSTLVARDGEFIWAPRDMPHYYDVTGKEGARVLVIATPGGFLPEFFRAVAEGKGAKIGDGEQLEDFAGWAKDQFGIRFFPPDHEFAEPEW